MTKKPSPRSRPNKQSKQPSPRLPKLAMESFDPEQQAIVDAINSGPRGRFSNEGPFAVFLHAPVYGMLAQQLGGHLRFKTGVPPRLSEFAILCTGQYWKAQFEWYAHLPMALKAGLDPKIAAGLARNEKPENMRDDEAAVYDFCTQLHRTKQVSDAAYRRAVELLGEQGVMDLIGVSGFYTAVSMTLNVAQAPLPAGEENPLK